MWLEICRNGSYPRAIDEDTIHQPVTTILKISVRHRDQDIKISVGSVAKTIHGYLHMQKSARWVSNILKPFQKQERVQGSFSHVPRKPELIQDETWVHHYDPERIAEGYQGQEAWNVD
nr:uncharacterized protein LOC113803980 [Penaeus vannamei]